MYTRTHSDFCDKEVCVDCITINGDSSSTANSAMSYDHYPEKARVLRGIDVAWQLSEFSDDYPCGRLSEAMLFISSAIGG